MRPTPDRVHLAGADNFLSPHYAQFPKDEAGFAIEDQFYVGNSGLLMKPVTTEGATETSVYLSDNQVSNPITLYPLVPSLIVCSHTTTTSLITSTLPPLNLVQSPYKPHSTSSPFSYKGVTSSQSDSVYVEPLP